MNTQPAVIHFFHDGLSQDEARGFEHAMHTLPEHLLQPPTEINICVVPIPYQKMVDMLSELNKVTNFCDAPSLCHDVIGVSTGSRLPKYIMGCTPDHPLALLAKQQNNSAQWGAACGDFAAVYKLQPCVIWHEALHLIGAEDCYSESDCRPTCDQPNCIMQFEPTNTNINSRPFLCEKNCELIRKRLITQTDHALDA